MAGATVISFGRRKRVISGEHCPFVHLFLGFQLPGLPAESDENSMAAE